MADYVTSETVEGAFAVPREIISRLPECHEADVARTHLNQAERLVHAAREKQKQRGPDED